MHTNTKTVLLLLSAALPGWGQCSSSTPALVFPHLVNGSGWKSSLYLMNESASFPANYTLAFRGDTAQPVLMFFSDGRRDNQINGVIAPGGLAILDTPGLDSDPLVAASAILSTTGTVSGFTIFRERQAGLPDREATAPLVKSASRGLTFPFDNTEGFDFSIALTVICGPTSKVVLTANAADETGAPLGHSELNIARGGHTAFMVSGELPGTKAKRGSIRIGITGPTGTNVQLAGLGLRFSPTGGLTYFPSSPWLPAPAPVVRYTRGRAKK